MNDFLLRGLELYFPSIAEDIKECKEDMLNTLIVKTNDGNVYLYDGNNNSIRTLPSEGDNLTEENFKREFSFRIKRIMERKGITQKDLSQMTGIPQPRISQYISGRHLPNFYKMDKIARALGCSMDDLRYL